MWKLKKLGTGRITLLEKEEKYEKGISKEENGREDKKSKVKNYKFL